MHAHPELIAAFDAALKGGPPPPGVTARRPHEVERRLDVYRNNVAASLVEALGLRFPVIRRLVGDDFFRPMARLYAEADRPKSPVLSEWGEGFAAFLEHFPPLGPYPYMGDVARIEFARGVAYHSADAAPAEASLFAGADPATLRLHPHPSVAVLRLAHPAVSIWAANQPGAPSAAIPAGPEIALVLRDRAFEVPVCAVSPGDATMIEALLARATLAEAAAQAGTVDPDHDPQPVLLALMRAGAIIAPEVSRC